MAEPEPDAAMEERSARLSLETPSRGRVQVWMWPCVVCQQEQIGQERYSRKEEEEDEEETDLRGKM
jgi:hypothetical protein